MVGTDNLVILIAEHLADVNRRVVASPQLATIQIPFPMLPERERFIGSQDLSRTPMEMDASAFAKMTAGLSRTQIRNILRGAQQSGEQITFRSVSLRKKKIIEQECHGLVEFVDPDHDFRHVGGMTGIKETLMRVASAIKRGDKRRVPMGVLFVGPMGGCVCRDFAVFMNACVEIERGSVRAVLTEYRFPTPLA